MISVIKKFEFEAAHYLPDYEGACSTMHGHTFKLEIELTADKFLNGMIIDFSQLKKIVAELVLEKLDHKVLNDIIPTPTSENIILWIRNRLGPIIANFSEDKSNNLELIRVRLYETSNSYAEWKE